jgi:H+/Cl- antiporter ClcA
MRRALENSKRQEELQFSKTDIICSIIVAIIGIAIVSWILLNDEVVFKAWNESRFEFTFWGGLLMCLFPIILGVLGAIFNYRFYRFLIPKFLKDLKKDLKKDNLI